MIQKTIALQPHISLPELYPNNATNSQRLRYLHQIHSQIYVGRLQTPRTQCCFMKCGKR